jgi:SAM-dependent methyltransferase
VTTETVGARPAWDAIASRFDQFTAPVTTALGDELAHRLGVGRGTRFLDVAAGSGALAIPAARRGAAVVAVDIAPTIVERLRARVAAEGLTNVEALVMDCRTLDLPDGNFDMVASLNGVSLLPDVGRSLGEMVRVTRPGGRVMVAAFGPPQRVELLAFFLAALQSTVRGFAPPPMDAPLPFRLTEPESLLCALIGTGLRAVNVDTIAWPMAFRSGDHLWDVVTSNGPISAELVAQLTDEQRTKVCQVLDGMLRDRSGGRPGATLHTELNVGTGTK